MAEYNYNDQENRSRTIKALLLIAGFVLFLLLVINLFRYSYTTIKVNDTTGSTAGFNVVLKDRETGEAAYTYLLENGETEVSGFMKRSDYVVEVLTQNAGTRKSVSSGFLFTNIDVSLEPQIESNKISYTNESCVAQTSSGEAVSYSCLRATPIFVTKYVAGGVQKSIANDETHNLYKTYRSGALALEENYNDQMLLDFRGFGFEADKQVDISASISGYENGDPLALIVDSTGNSEQFEVYDFSRSRLIVFKNIDDDEPRVVELNEVVSDPTEGSSYVFTQNGEEVIAYYGLSDFSADSEKETETYDSYGGGTLIFFDLNGSNHSFVPLDKDFLINDLRITNNYLIAETQFDLEIYDLGERDGLKHKSTIPLSQDAALYGEGSFVFISDNNLYRYDLSDQSYKLLYAGNRFLISAVNVVGDKIYFSAFLNGDNTQNLHGFVLTSNPAEFPRIEERLPYPPGTAGVSHMDYFENRVFVYLALSSFDYSNGSYDTSEFDKKKIDFLRRFEADGFNPSDFSIEFQPS